MRRLARAAGAGAARATASGCSASTTATTATAAPTAWRGSTSCWQREGIADADGEVWLHCYPRVLGYAFKPVSFWYCHRADGALAAVVVEVNNTFGERHCYLLARRRQLGFGPRAARAQGLPRLAVLRRQRQLPLPLHAHRSAAATPA